MARQVKCYKQMTFRQGNNGDAEQLHQLGIVTWATVQSL
jgi:hypothetical protein